MKNQYDDIELYTPVTVHIVSIGSNGGLSKMTVLVVLFKLWDIIILILALYNFDYPSSIH